MTGCGKTVVNQEAPRRYLAVYAVFEAGKGGFSLVYSRSQGFYAAGILASGPKGRGFESRHFDQTGSLVR